MKFVVALLMFCAFGASAEGLLTLTPGTSLTIEAGEKTQVYCAATAPIKCECAKQDNGKFCARYYNFEDGDFYCAGPGNSTALFDTSADCQLALPAIPACY